MAYVDKINNNNVDYDIQDSKAARSVNGTTASHVEEANQIYTETTQTQTSDFIFRTTAGDVSISTGNATLNYIEGNTVQTGHTDEVLTMNPSFEDPTVTATLNETTWRSYVSVDGTYEFIHQGSKWELNSNEVTLANYGITVTGTPANGDTITVDYTQLVVGTLTTATPASFVSTGFNQYDADAGYAHVKGDNQYRIDGTYTSLGFTTTVGGATTTVTVTDSKFTPTEDGYIYVNGGSGDILIALVWSGTMDGEPFTAYSADTIDIPVYDIDANDLPYIAYGLPSVHGVADRISFVDKTYIQKIGHEDYSVENLATVEALGVDYWYDNTDIFYVLSSPITYALEDTVSGAYIANDYGTEEFTGTSVPVVTNITYGNSLVDKLRNMVDIQSIGTGLTLTGTELSASGGGSASGIKVLTANDYNWNATAHNATTTPFDSIAPWILDSGCYKMPTDVYTVNETYSNKTTSGWLNGRAFFVSKVDIDGMYKNNTCLLTYYPTTAAANSFISMPYSDSGILQTSSPTNGYILTRPDIANDLTSTQWYKVLSAAQGKVLNDTITPSSGAAAPTTSTVGVLGKIYIDTSTDNAYMCTKVSGSTYTWKQITN